MGTISQKYPATSTFRQEVEAAKAKLKDAPPEANRALIRSLKSKVERKSAKSLVNPPPPIEIHALADLHLEALYYIDCTLISPKADADPWTTAVKYVDYKAMEVPYPSPTVPPSRTPSAVSLHTPTTPKMVRFAEIEPQLVTYDKSEPPKNIRATQQ